MCAAHFSQLLINIKGNSCRQHVILSTCGPVVNVPLIWRLVYQFVVHRQLRFREALQMIRAKCAAQSHQQVQSPIHETQTAGNFHSNWLIFLEAVQENKAVLLWTYSVQSIILFLLFHQLSADDGAEASRLQLDLARSTASLIFKLWITIPLLTLTNPVFGCLLSLLSAPSGDNYVIFNSRHSVAVNDFTVSFWTVSWQWLHTSRLFAVQVFSSYVSCGPFADLWRPRRHVP